MTDLIARLEAAELVKHVSIAMQNAAVGKATWDDVAVAAIRAMRNPSDDIIAAGDEQILAFLNDHDFALKESTPAEKCWQAMIEAALRARAAAKGE